MLTDPRKRRATSTRTTTAGAVLAVAFLLAFPVSALAQAANPLDAVAGTFDGQTVRFYLDGLQVGSGTAASAPVGYALDNDDFVLGRYPLQAGCASGYYTGATDEVRVYSRALSASEIGRLQTAPGSTPPVLQPDATPPPPPPPPGLPNPPGPPTPPPGQAGPAPAPRVTAVASALPIVASRPALLSAQVAGSAQRLEWDLTGDGDGCELRRRSNDAGVPPTRAGGRLHRPGLGARRRRGRSGPLLLAEACDRARPCDCGQRPGG